MINSYPFKLHTTALILSTLKLSTFVPTLRTSLWICFLLKKSATASNRMLVEAYEYLNQHAENGFDVKVVILIWEIKNVEDHRTSSKKQICKHYSIRTIHKVKKWWQNN